MSNLNDRKEKMCEEVGALYFGLAIAQPHMVRDRPACWSELVRILGGTDNGAASGHVVAPAAFTFRFVLCGVLTLRPGPWTKRRARRPSAHAQAWSTPASLSICASRLRA